MRPRARLIAAVLCTLAREPAHFGALAGKAIILLRQGRTAEGRLALIEALDIHSWPRERALPGPGDGL